MKEEQQKFILINFKCHSCISGVFFKLRRLHSNLHRMTVVVSDGTQEHNDSPGAGTFSQATRHFPVIWRPDVGLNKRSEEWPFKPGPCDLFSYLICTRQ